MIKKLRVPVQKLQAGDQMLPGRETVISVFHGADMPPFHRRVVTTKNTYVLNARQQCRIERWVPDEEE